MPVLAALYMINVSIHNSPLFPPVPGDPVTPFLYVKLPLIIAALIMGFLILSLYSNFNKELTVTPQTLTYKKGGSNFTVLWKNLSFTPPRYDKKRFKTFTVSDGNRFGRIEEIYFPAFETMVDVIKAAKAGQGQEISI
jgi:hypothetical protein